MYQNRTMDRGKSNPKVDSADNGKFKLGEISANGPSESDATIILIEVRQSTLPSYDTECLFDDFADPSMRYDERQIESALNEIAELPNLFGKPRPTGTPQSPWLDNCPRIIEVAVFDRFVESESLVRLLFRAASSEAGRKHIWIGPFAGRGIDILGNKTEEFLAEFPEIPRNVIPSTKGGFRYSDRCTGLLTVVGESCEIGYDYCGREWMILGGHFDSSLSSTDQNSRMVDNIRTLGMFIFTNYDLNKCHPNLLLREVPNWIRSGELIDRGS